MSAAAGTADVARSGGPSLRIRAAAVAVVIALALLAAYTVFSGPTKVTVKLPSSTQTRTAPPRGEPRTETEGREQGD